MEWIWIIILAPMIATVVLSIFYWRCRPGKICRSTAELLKPVLYDERGQDLIEYALMAGFVAVVVMVIFMSPVARIICACAAVAVIIFGVIFILNEWNHAKDD